MRGLHTFVAISILAGILSSTMGYEEFSSSDDPISIIFEKFRGRIEETILQMCENNGRPMSHGTFDRIWENLSSCTESLVTIPELTADGTTAFSYGKSDEFVAKYCHKLPPLMECVRDIDYSTVKLCLRWTHQEALVAVWNVTSVFLQFLCQNDGNRFASFINAGGFECVNSKSALLSGCIEEAMKSYFRFTVRQMINPMLDGRLEKFGIIEELQTCTVEVIQQCDDPSSANVVDTMFDSYRSGADCESTTEAQTIPTSASINLDEAECWTPKREAIQKCVEQYLFRSFSSSWLRVPRIALIEQCNTDLKRLRQCVVDVFGESEDPIVVNMMESLINNTVKVTPCKDSLNSYNEILSLPVY